MGLDATMYLRFLRMATHFLTLQVIITCPLLLILHWYASSPISISTSPSTSTSISTTFNNNTTTGNSSSSSPSHVTAGIIIDDVDNSEYYNNITNAFIKTTTGNTYTDFRSNATLYQLSISNVPHEASIMWVHVILTWVISLTWLWLLFVNYWHHLLLLLQKQQHDNDTDENKEQSNNNNNNKEQLQPDDIKQHKVTYQHVRRSHTVLLTNVPHHLRNVQSLYQHFSSEIGPIHHVYLVSQVGINELNRVLKKRQYYIDQLEHKLILWHRRRHHHSAEKEQENYCCQRRRHYPNEAASLLCWLPNITNNDDPDLIRLVRKIDRLDIEIGKLREYNMVSTRYQLPTGTAFITFK